MAVFHGCTKGRGAGTGYDVTSVGFFFIASEIDSCLFSVGAQGEGELGVAMIPPAVADTKGRWPVITAWSVAVFCGFLDL